MSRATWTGFATAAAFAASAAAFDEEEGERAEARRELEPDDSALFHGARGVTGGPLGGVADDAEDAVRAAAAGDEWFRKKEGAPPPNPTKANADRGDEA